jgi:hypothetical protein
MLLTIYNRFRRVFGIGLPSVRPVFLHIPKTAGMSIRHALKERYSGQWSVSVNIRELPQLREMPEWRFSRCAFYAGHFGMETVKRVKSKKFVFTFLRDPLDRVVSNYYYFKSLEDERPSTAVVLAKRLPFLDWLSCDDPSVRYVTEDLQARHLTESECLLSSLSLDTSADPQDRAEAAIGVLKGFNYIGLVERSAESMAEISKQLGVSINRWENSTARRPSINDLSKAERDAIEERVQGDRIIYEWAFEKWLTHRGLLSGDSGRLGI